MFEIRLDDPHFAENALAALSLKKMGCPDDELERLYQKQLAKDAEGDETDVIPMLQCRNCKYDAPTASTCEQANCRDERRYQ